MIALYVVTLMALIISALMNMKKTLLGLKIAWMKFHKSLPSYVVLLMIISIILLISEDFMIGQLTTNSPILSVFYALIIGSVTMMPGFIAYPLAKILVSKGVSYMVVSAFVTSLMLVGVVTFPLEKNYFGTKLTLLRNMVGFLIALCIALITGLIYGELL
jgi:uncharacterized membrane protein YraQ (UPF0718 family)